MTPTVQYLDLPVEDLRPNPFNPNRVSANNEAKIRESISRNGLFKPIIVRQVPGVPGYEIIGGQHRWEQAIALGHPKVPCANLGEITDARAKEIGLIDNARYGVDDTITLSAILKELGDVSEIQTFLPYGDNDLTAIFSASDIDLDTLDVGREEQNSSDPEPENDAPATKPSKTHTVMRFKISLGDAERLTQLIARTQKDQGLTAEDDLTNAGDALIHLLRGAGLMTAPAAQNWDEVLDGIEADINTTE